MPTTYAIPNGALYMYPVLRTGTGSSGGSVTSLLFQPDLIWDKPRSNAGDHVLTDSVRGTASQLHTNTTGSQDTSSQFITAFNSNGYTIGTSDWNAGWTLVDWCWKAGGTAVSNTSGSITSQVSANTTAGFSVVTYTGNSTNNATVGHGLGVVPSMIILKNRSGAYDWPCYHTSIGSGGYIYLNQNATKATDANMWKTTPTSTVFTLGTYTENNGSSNNYVAYCFAAVAGYSAFGSYTGNGSADGPFVYTGFRPRFILTKDSSAVGNWFIQDTSRGTYNAVGNSGSPDSPLAPNTSGSETDWNGAFSMDILSNGFKLRNTAASMNTSGDTYIYYAVAENPFKFSNAR